MLLRIFSLLVGVFFLSVAALVFKPTLLEHVLVAEQTMTQADALVVMAGSRFERVPAAAELYHQGAAPRILLTNDGVLGGWSSKYQRNLYAVEWAQEQLLELEVPVEAIELLNYIESGSYYDALNTREFAIADGGVRSLLVVTSHYHSQRTLWVFQRVFAGMEVEIGVYAIPKDPQYTGRWLRTLTVEMVKMVFYRVYYGMFGAADPGNSN